MAKLIGTRLLDLRGSRRQAEVAARAGMTAIQYGRYERGERVPTDDVLDRLAYAFGCPVETIIGDASATGASDAVGVSPVTNSIDLAAVNQLLRERLEDQEKLLVFSMRVNELQEDVASLRREMATLAPDAAKDAELERLRTKNDAYLRMVLAMPKMLRDAENTLSNEVMPDQTEATHLRAEIAARDREIEVLRAELNRLVNGGGPINPLAGEPTAAEPGQAQAPKKFLFNDPQGGGGGDPGVV